MLRIAICDDDKILVTQIEEMLNRYLDKKMIDRYIEILYDGASLERIYEKGDRFDIIYLDIEMSGKNGIEAAKSIRRLDRDVLLIYVSSYETYFMQLFEVEPFRFIKKPIKETEFEEVIDFAYERIIEEEPFRFMSKPINDKRFYMFLDLAIDRIRSANGIYCFRFNKDILTVILIVLKGKLYKFYKKLDDVEKEISVNYSIPFIRIHKSYLVNFQQIRKVGYTEVETKDGRILNISDTYKKDVRARYSKLLWDGDV